MQTTHTPGPWELRQSGRDYWFIDHEQGGESYTLTKLENWTNEADARLIAAAPDLLAALQKIDANAAESVEWIRRVAREAISKATGGAA
jgi:hypothetical protein